jgi:hypothetical protein
MIASVQYSTVQYSTVQYSTVQYSTVHHTTYKSFTIITASTVLVLPFIVRMAAIVQSISIALLQREESFFVCVFFM